MAQLGLIACGGALGALLRFAVSSMATQIFGRGFPYGTLIVNLVGSCLIGLLYVALSERVPGAEHWRALLMVGFLGALTTFSTFSLETVHLLESGAVLKAALNITLSVLLCIFGCWLGLSAGRQL